MFDYNILNPEKENKTKKTKDKKKERLDVLLVEKGFFNSRESAKRHIMTGIVLVENVPIDKAGTKVPINASIRLKGQIMPYVGRGGYKLEKALKSFHITLKDKVMADFGASTGGFTDCALQNGIKKVFAIDVGYNQLDWELRNNTKVVNMEKTNIKDISFDILKEKVEIEEDLVYPLIKSSHIKNFKENVFKKYVLVTMILFYIEKIKQFVCLVMLETDYLMNKR